MSKIDYIRIFTPMGEKIGNFFRSNTRLVCLQLQEINKIKKIKLHYSCTVCRNIFAAAFVKKSIVIKCHFCNAEWTGAEYSQIIVNDPILKIIEKRVKNES